METPLPEHEREMRARPLAAPRPDHKTGRDCQAALRAAANDLLDTPGTPAQSRTGIDRLTQFLSGFLTRRGFAQAGVGLALALGAEATADAKKKRKRNKRKKKSKPGSNNPNPTPTPTDPACSPACEGGNSCQDGLCVCTSDVLCNQTCCALAEACVRGECCPNNRVCNSNCCDTGEVCENISPGGAKGCCSNPLVVRGETCCPTGSLSTRLNCGSYQCALALSGSGPGGCDLWCKVGYEGAGCGPGVPGFPAEDPGRGCCCNEIANPGVCTYPVPGNSL